MGGMGTPLLQPGSPVLFSSPSQSEGTATTEHRPRPKALVQARNSADTSLTGAMRSMATEDAQFMAGQLLNLTSRTGSFLYMGPEVFRGEPYNTKADVFSFAVCMYEMLHMRSLLVTVLASANPDPDSRQRAIVEYASSVAAGYRPPLHSTLLPSLRQLLNNCWSTNPLERPTMTTVVERLQHILLHEGHRLDATQPDQGCCCVIS
ncbi:kinase-like domain-containing protein [Haematococcus lacustris]